MADTDNTAKDDDEVPEKKGIGLKEVGGAVVGAGVGYVVGGARPGRTLGHEAIKALHDNFEQVKNSVTLPAGSTIPDNMPPIASKLRDMAKWTKQLPKEFREHADIAAHVKKIEDMGSFFTRPMVIIKEGTWKGRTALGAVIAAGALATGYAIHALRKSPEPSFAKREEDRAASRGAEPSTGVA